MKRSARSDERGFTLTELVVTVTILGLIAVPLCSALVQAVTIAPESSARAQRASDRQFLADSFATDAGRAVDATLYEPGNQTAIDITSTGSETRSVPCAQVSPAKDMFRLKTAKLQYPNEAAAPGHDFAVQWDYIVYSVEIVPIAGQPAASVTITRAKNGVPDDVTVGYCSTSSPASAVEYKTATKSCADGCVLQHQSIDLNLKISPQPLDPVEQVEFEGAIAKSTGTAPA